MLQMSQLITVHLFHTLHAIAVYAVISLQKVKGQIHFPFPFFFFFLFFLFSSLIFPPTLILAHPKVTRGRPYKFVRFIIIIAISVFVLYLFVISRNSSMYLWTSSRTDAHTFAFDALDSVHMITQFKIMAPSYGLQQRVFTLLNYYCNAYDDTAADERLCCTMHHSLHGSAELL